MHRSTDAANEPEDRRPFNGWRSFRVCGTDPKERLLRVTRTDIARVAAAATITAAGLALTHTAHPHRVAPVAAAVVVAPAAAPVADLLRVRRVHAAATRSLIRHAITRARVRHLARLRHIAAVRAASRAAAARSASPRVTAPAAGIPAVWRALVQCEAGGDWHRESGDGFYGGPQFTLGTWTANGGTGDPAAAAPATQLAVARRVLATQGVGAWPVCGPRVGLEPGD